MVASTESRAVYCLIMDILTQPWQYGYMSVYAAGPRKLGEREGICLTCHSNCDAKKVVVMRIRFRCGYILERITFQNRTHHALVFLSNTPDVQAHSPLCIFCSSVRSLGVQSRSPILRARLDEVIHVWPAFSVPRSS